MPRDRANHQAWLRKWRAEHPESVKRSMQAWRDLNPERSSLIVRIGMRITRAIQRGQLTRPEKCEWCGLTCKPEAAHKSYDAPLDVLWLCRPCHRQWDADNPKSLGALK